MQIGKEVLEKITPRKEERSLALGQVNAFLKELNVALKEQGLKAKAVLGGSYAKDTWLAGDYDVDIFVKFKGAHKEQNISDLLQSALGNWSFERVHGSRDYFWVRNNIRYEIIPVLDITTAKQAQNVTDFSPLHVAWVNKFGAKYKGDIRLVKKFCKVAGCYGAESYIRGFSGHVVDILTIYYGGFLPLLRAATKWKPKVIVDFNKVYGAKALLLMNKSKTQGPMVVVDPIQPQRNAAAALTDDNLEKFMVQSKRFIKKPSVSFFEEKVVDFGVLAKQGVLCKIAVQTGDGKEDVVGAKFVRAFEFVCESLSEFGVKKKGWLWDKKKEGVWWVVVKVAELQKMMDWIGPPKNMSAAVERFKKIYKKTKVQKGRIVARVERKETTPNQVLARVLRDEFVQSRVVVGKIEVFGKE